jgi:hypothetical protein
VRQALARSMKINARPLTRAEWQHLFTEHGLVVDHVETAPMALLQPRRLVSDEGLQGALCFARNLARDTGCWPCAGSSVNIVIILLRWRSSPTSMTAVRPTPIMASR